MSKSIDAPLLKPRPQLKIGGFMNKFLSLAISLILAVSCASQSEKDTKNPFDPSTLKENLVEGKTTQTQMMQTFGAPDMVTEDSSKEDVWTYSQTKHVSNGSNLNSGITAFLPIPMLAWADIGGGVSNNESASKSVTLMVYFNKKKVLKSYQINKVKL